MQIWLRHLRASNYSFFFFDLERKVLQKGSTWALEGLHGYRLLPPNLKSELHPEDSHGKKRTNSHKLSSDLHGHCVRHTHSYISKIHFCNLKKKHLGVLRDSSVVRSKSCRRPGFGSQLPNDTLQPPYDHSISQGPSVFWSSKARGSHLAHIYTFRWRYSLT